MNRHEWLSDEALARLMSSGAVEGPYKRPRPLTLSWMTRIKRALASLIRR